MSAEGSVATPVFAPPAGSQNGGNTAHSIFATAMGRWLYVSEIEALLRPESTPLSVSPRPPATPPPSGTLLLFDRSATRNYKDDGHDWIKKKDGTRVREDHVKLRVGGRYRVAGSYVHHSTITTMKRRAYHIIDPNTGRAPNRASLTPLLASLCASTNAAGGESTTELLGTLVGSAIAHQRSLVLVHYLDTDLAAKHSAEITAQVIKLREEQKRSMRMAIETARCKKRKNREKPRELPTSQQQTEGEKKMAATSPATSLPPSSATISSVPEVQNVTTSGYACLPRGPPLRGVPFASEGNEDTLNILWQTIVEGKGNSHTSEATSSRSSDKSECDPPIQPFTLKPACNQHASTTSPVPLAVSQAQGCNVPESFCSQPDSENWGRAKIELHGEVDAFQPQRPPKNVVSQPNNAPMELNFAMMPPPPARLLHQHQQQQQQLQLHLQPTHHHPAAAVTPSPVSLTPENLSHLQNELDQQMRQFHLIQRLQQQRDHQQHQLQNATNGVAQQLQQEVHISTAPTPSMYGAAASRAATLPDESHQHAPSAPAAALGEAALNPVPQIWVTAPLPSDASAAINNSNNSLEALRKMLPNNANEDILSSSAHASGPHCHSSVGSISFNTDIFADFPTTTSAAAGAAGAAAVIDGSNPRLVATAPLLSLDGRKRKPPPSASSLSLSSD